MSRLFCWQKTRTSRSNAKATSGPPLKAPQKTPSTNTSEFHSSSFSMGSAASKPVKSAAGAASRRQYPKQPAPPPRGPRKAPKETEAASAPSPTPTPKPKPQASPSTPRASAAPSQGPTYHSKEQASSVKSNGTYTRQRFFKVFHATHARSGR